MYSNSFVLFVSGVRRVIATSWYFFAIAFVVGCSYGVYKYQAQPQIFQTEMIGMVDHVPAKLVTHIVNSLDGSSSELIGMSENFVLQLSSDFWQENNPNKEENKELIIITAFTSDTTLNLNELSQKIVDYVNEDALVKNIALFKLSNNYLKWKASKLSPITVIGKYVLILLAMALGLAFLRDLIMISKSESSN